MCARACTTPRRSVTERGVSRGSRGVTGLRRAARGYALIGGTRSCLHLRLGRVCLLPSHGLPHVAPRYEGRKSARSPGHQDRRNLSPRLSVSFAIASERFARPVRTPSCWQSLTVDPSVASRVHRTDGRSVS